MFTADLAVGHLNETVVATDLAYRGLPLTETPPGKFPFDRFLPDGRSIEIKLDLRSQGTHYAAIESATIDRQPDFIAHTICYYLVFPFEDYQALYRRGKIHKFGDQMYEGRLVTTSEMRNSGMYGDEFVKSLTQRG